MENGRTPTKSTYVFATLAQAANHLERHLGEQDVGLHVGIDDEPALRMQQLWFAVFDACSREGGRASVRRRRIA